MSERNYSRAWTGMLTEEAGRWVRQGLISEEQRKAILGLYPEPGAGDRDRTILIFTILGSLLVGAGVILFFAANWPKLPAVLKVGAIMAAVVGAYGAGYHLQYQRGDYPRLGHSLIFLGALFYGAAIWLVAQIFHLDSHYPNGFLLWAMGVLPVAWALRSRAILYLSTILLGIWTIGEQGEFQHYNWLFPVLLLGAVLPQARRLRDGLVEAAVLVGLFLWFAINVAVHHEAGAIGYEGQIMARLMLLYGAAVLAGGLARLGDQRVYLGVGSLAALLGTYILTFQLRQWAPADAAMPSLLWGWPFALVGSGLMLGAFVACAVLYWRRAEPMRAIMLGAVSTPVVAALLLHLLEQVPRMVTFNLLLFSFTVGLIALSVQRQSQLLLNMGLITFIVHMITRYADLFFDAMDKSLFFVMGGLLLLGGGWLLERNRRRWMRDWGGDGHDV